jgi:GntR family transcriptional regulator
VPLYRQIASEVKAAFLRGFLQPGERLPSVRELAAQQGLNPTTVVKAYDLLDHERLIVRRQGQGAFVAGGTQPLAPDERKAIVDELAAALALEGRRLAWSEEELIQALREQLEALRPEAEPAQERAEERES